MIDLWFIDGLVMLAAFLWPVSVLMRGMPHLEPGPGLILPELEKTQKIYEVRYRWRSGCRWMVLILAIYLEGRAFASPWTDLEDWSGVLPLAVGAGTCLLVGSIVGTFFRYRNDRAFVEAHPQFAQGLVGPWPRLAALIATAIPIFGSVFIARQNDGPTILATIGVCLAASALTRKLLMASIVKRQIPVAIDSPLGQQIASVVTQFGFVPKRVILIPSLTSNGAALPDGTVWITTALTVLLSPDEVTAVLAHELSHARDRDAKKLLRARWLCWLGVGIFAGFFEVPLFMNHTPPEVAMPAAAFLTALGFMVVSWPIGRLSHRLEYKCDADAARLGFGRELASALTKLYAFMGLGTHWVGLDRFILTHPSTDQRIERLLAASANALVP